MVSNEPTTMVVVSKVARVGSSLRANPVQPTRMVGLVAKNAIHLDLELE